MKYKFTIHRDIERAIAIFRNHNERYEKTKPMWCDATYDEWAEFYNECVNEE